MPEQELTGRRRFDLDSIAGYEVLVLQVEYSEWSPVYKAHICYWRDATPADLGKYEVVIRR